MVREGVDRIFRPVSPRCVDHVRQVFPDMPEEE